MIAPVLVGELNPYGSAPEFALYCEPQHSAGGRLCRLVCGLRPTTYLALARVNLCSHRWDWYEAREKADEMVRSAAHAGGGTIVMLGAKVAQAFGWKLKSFTHGFAPNTMFATLVYLPHPSGRNLAWNAPGAFKRARDLLRELCPEVPWGEMIDPTVTRLTTNEPSR